MSFARMATAKLLNHLSWSVHRAYHDKRGNVAILFACTALVIIACMGGAVDIGSAQKIKNRLQAAADAAVLAAASAPNKSLADLKISADKMFDQNNDTSYTVSSKELTQSGEIYAYSANVEYATILLNVIGMPKINIAVSASATPRTQPTELVIVVDTTASMGFGSSWTDAKNVINDTLTTLSNSKLNSEDLYITLLPISDRVNVGNDKDNWLSTPMPSAWNGCLAPREENHSGFAWALSDAPPGSSAFEPSAVGYDDVYTNANASWVDHGTNGNPHDDNLPICPAKLTGPTNNTQQIALALDALTPQGTGRFDEAMAWAWRLISPKWVNLWGLSDYPRPYAKRRKIVVFISDGHTEAYRHEVGGDGDGVTSPNLIFGWNLGSKYGFEHLVHVCDLMKANEIEIHMIKVNGNGHVAPYFQQCASNPNFFYEVGGTSAFQDAIATVRSRILNTRLTE